MKTRKSSSEQWLLNVLNESKDVLNRTLDAIKENTTIPNDVFLDAYELSSLCVILCDERSRTVPLVLATYLTQLRVCIKKITEIDGYRLLVKNSGKMLLSKRLLQGYIPQVNKHLKGCKTVFKQGTYTEQAPVVIEVEEVAVPIMPAIVDGRTLKERMADIKRKREEEESNWEQFHMENPVDPNYD